jgi:hypothetical protein
MARIKARNFRVVGAMWKVSRLDIARKKMTTARATPRIENATA